MLEKTWLYLAKIDDGWLQLIASNAAQPPHRQASPRHHPDIVEVIQTRQKANKNVAFGATIRYVPLVSIAPGFA
jgi:hypothetical protein